MTALEFIKSLPHLPYSVEHTQGRPSNSEIFRWLTKGSVVINGKTPQPKEEIEFPITELVFFPKGIRKVTMV